MSITSTRKVSSSYSPAVKGGYETAQGRQSFVETIDTTNNVLVSDDTNSGKQSYYAKEKSEENTFDQQNSSASQENLENSIQTGNVNAPLIDNDADADADDSKLDAYRNVGIYGANQIMSMNKNDTPTNPYLKNLYEKNEIVEDIDELI